MKHPTFPGYGDYDIAINNLSTFARHPLISAAEPERDAASRLVAYSGGYSRVYPVRAYNRMFALRCLTAKLPEARDRYLIVSAYLRMQKLSYFVDFEYLEDALFVKGHLWPVVWMEWAEGRCLREFANSHLGNAEALRNLAYAFREMVAILHERNISHGDLQDENILVSWKGTVPQLRLVDYDGLFVPGLYGFPEATAGHTHYQHPQRIAVRTASPSVDYFSELVIYLSLLAYAAKPQLWNDSAETRLLFSETDFANPARSPVFRELAGLPGEIPELANILAEFCLESDPLRLRPLELVIAETASSRTADTNGLGFTSKGALLSGVIKSGVPGEQDRGNRVLVVYGRNQRLRDDLFTLLRAAGLEPIEWGEAITLTGQAAPYIGQVLDAAFANAQAVVVLLTPDDEVRLTAAFWKEHDGPHERELRGQPRANVLFEAGLALGLHPGRTVLVQVGDVKSFSDVAGRHIVHLDDNPESRRDLLSRLGAAGCNVRWDRGDWLRVGRFVV